MSRYSRVQRYGKNGITRIGTSNLPMFEEDNSDILLIAVDGDRCDLIATE